MNDRSANGAGRIGRILIVGGGTAGWMAAAYLRRRTGCQIALVESPNVAPVGVGEATIPALIDFLRALKLDEDEFMRRCHATYKLGIEFVDWIQPQHRYWHPFGLCGGEIDGIDLFHFWLKRRRASETEEPYAAYSLQAALARAGKSHRPIGGKPVVHNYAYHLDAAAFADYLKSVSTQLGVKHVLADVQRVVTDERGWIEGVELADGRDVKADLYVDCTGFKGLLIEQALEDPYHDWSNTLLCDRAVVVRLPPDQAVSPYTQATAVTAGWIWQIPLSNRLGCGYVYSSAHVSADAATRELLSFAGLDDAAAIELRHLTMRVGRRQTFWKANCVAVGLSSGFIEPLESTGIFLIQRALEVLIDCFPDQSCNAALRQVYNGRLAEAYEEIRDFVLLHYYLSQRDAPAFWSDARRVPVPDSMSQRLGLYDDTAMVVESLAPVFRQMNFYYIYAGSGRLPRNYHARADFSDFGNICQVLDRIKASNERIVGQMPSHRELIGWLHG